MATKPTIGLARFADTVSASRTAPSSGLRDTGFVAGSLIVESIVSELFFRNYEWANYLNDGALSGNHTIAGTLGVSSALTVTSGGLTVTAGGATITGAVAITGAASVSSGFVASGGITVPTSQVVNLQGTTTLSVGGAATVGGTLGVTGVLTASGGVTVPTGQNITLAGTADEKHGDREVTVSAIAARSASAFVAFALAPARIDITAAATIVYPIQLKVGDRIKSVALSILGNGSADIIQFEVFKTTAAGVDSSIGSTTVTNPAATWANAPLDVTDTTLATGEAFTLVVVTNATGISLGNLRVIFDRP